MLLDTKISSTLIAMRPSLQYSKDGKVDSPLSAYQPSMQVKAILSLSDTDLELGDEILNRSFTEFNDMSLIDRANADQKDWLGWSPSPSDNPDEAWMFTGTSSITRNKIISTAAHLTQQVIYPGVFAQNEDDEVDEASAYVMKTAIEYNCRKNNYEQTFLYGVISGLVNPVSYFKVDYAEQYQDVLQGTSSNHTKKKVLDEVMSGFQHALLPLDEVLLLNPYCFDIQKQPGIIHRRRISFGEAKALYGHHPDFRHVTPGLKAVLNSANGLVYNVVDVADGLVEEAVFSYRGEDKMFTIVNGVYVSNPNTEYLPMRHRRSQIEKDGTTVDVPLYNIVKYGAEPIDAMRFAYYKSLASKLSNDKELVDRMRQNAVDASTFATFPSIFTVGAGKLDKSVFIPATITDLPKDSKTLPATGFANPSYAYNAAKEAEGAVSESSSSPEFSGNSGGGKTAREAIILQQNAISNLGVMGKMITMGMVKPIGELMVDDIIRYQTVGQTMDLGGGALGTKYATLVLNDKVIDGAKKNIVIKFTDEWAGRDTEMSEDEQKMKRVKMYEDKPENQELYEVNPAVFIRRKYLIVVEPDAFKPMNDAFDKTFKTELYDRAINNPLIANDPEKLAEVTRDFLFEPTVKGEASKYIPKDTKKVMDSIVPRTTPKEGVVGKTVDRNAMQTTDLGAQ